MNKRKRNIPPLIKRLREVAPLIHQAASNMGYDRWSDIPLVKAPEFFQHVDALEKKHVKG